MRLRRSKSLSQAGTIASGDISLQSIDCAPMKFVGEAPADVDSIGSGARSSLQWPRSYADDPRAMSRSRGRRCPTGPGACIVAAHLRTSRGDEYRATRATPHPLTDTALPGLLRPFCAQLERVSVVCAAADSTLLWGWRGDRARSTFDLHEIGVELLIRQGPIETFVENQPGAVNVADRRVVAGDVFRRTI